MARRASTPDLAVWWRTWSAVDDFVELDGALRELFAAVGIDELWLAVEDADGDLHVIDDGTEDEPPADPGASGWTADDLSIGSRRVGCVWHREAPQVDDDVWEELLAHASVAMDLVAARYGRRRLRTGLERLRQLSSTFAHALAPEDIADAAGRASFDLFGTSESAVYALRAGQLVDLAARRSDAASGEPVGLDVDVLVRAADADGMVVLDRDDITNGGRATAETTPSTTVVACLQVDDELVGALVIRFARRRALTPDDRRLVRLIADQTAQALRRAELVDASSAARFAHALDGMVDLVTIESAVRDDEGRIVDFQIDYMNQVQIDVAGRPRDEIIGRRLSEVYPATMDSELFEQYVRVVETGEPLLIDELPYEDVIDGKEVTGSYTLQATRFDDGIIVASRDISDAVAARHELRIAYEQLAAAQRLAQMGIWRIDLATQSLTFSDELYRLFELPTDEPVPDVPDSIVSLIHPRDRDIVRDLIERTPQTGEPFAVEITIRRPSGDGIVLATGSVAYDEQGNPRELWGTAQDITEQRRSERLLQSTTARLEQEHATVLMLQEAFAPELPVISWADVAGRYLAAGPDTQVGGDWYDVVTEDDHAYLMVGDVAGHGIRAVASMAQLRNAMRACAVQGLEPSQCLALANRLLTTTDHTQFATAVVARIDRGRGEVSWSSAGHPPLLLRGPSGTSYLEAKQGPPLGVVENGPYLEQTFALEPGDTLIAYTDGLVEQRKVPIDVRLAELSAIVDEVAGDDVGLLCRTVCNRMFVAQERRDDVCIVAFRPTARTEIEVPIGTSGAGPLR